MSIREEKRKEKKKKRKKFGIFRCLKAGGIGKGRRGGFYKLAVYHHSAPGLLRTLGLMELFNGKEFKWAYHLLF